jgi:protease-4
MSDWPPKPEQSSSTPTPRTPNAPEWQLLENVLMASVAEQRRSRRWGIFFKLLTLGYVVMVFVTLSRGCSSDDAMGTGHSEPHLAVIDIDGEIGGSRGVASDDIIQSLDDAFDAKQSRAIVLNINSPGGSPVQSDEIWQEIRRLRALHTDKKVYAVIGDMGASGAYYIASAADEIWVNPSSLVGSIGVIMPNYGLGGLAQKLGVEDRTMTSGAHKAILSMTKPIDAFEQAHVQGVLDDVHQHFIAAVKAGRGKRLKEDANTFSGLFWSGEQAITLGLADQRGGVNALARHLKVDHTVKYDVEHSPFEGLAARLGSSMGQGLGASLKLSWAEQAADVK